MFELIGILGVLAFVAAGIFSAEMDNVFLAFATFIIGLVTLQYGFGIAVWASIAANPLLLLGLFVINIMAGAVYTAVWRWPEYIRNNKKHILTSYDQWVADRGTTESNSFDTYLASVYYNYNAHSHKERLVTWIFMWSFSLVWELSRKPTVWMWKTTYACFGNMFQKIGLSAARKLHDDK
jgi:hypothetical protein